MEAVSGFIAASPRERERVCVCLLFQVSSPAQKPYLKKKRTESQALLPPSGAPALPACPLQAPAGQSEAHRRSGVGSPGAPQPPARPVRLRRRVPVSPDPVCLWGSFSSLTETLCCACIGCTRVSHCLMKAFFGKRKAPLIKHYKRKLPTKWSL